MKLVIAEKNQVAEAIVDAIGGGKREKGYYDCGEFVVVPCVGHMLALREPEDYDSRYEQWRMEDLPWCPIPWAKKPIEKTKDQLNVILRLLKSAGEVIHAGDPDEEGQLIVDEILQYADYRGPVKRTLINDNNTKVVQRAMANLRDNGEFAGMSAAAEARGVGDNVYGINLTRAYTLQARKKGYAEVLHVGRVSNAVLGLVARRTRENELHKAVNYFVVKGTFDVAGIQFRATYRVSEGDPVDDKGRISEQSFAQGIATAVAAKTARLRSVTTKESSKPAPLPYNLLRLQADASRLFGFKPDEVMAISQALKDQHRAITYNRTDTEYLSDEQYDDAAEVLRAVAATAPVLAGAVQKADLSYKSRAFNSAKVTVHHGIVPTQAQVDWAKLTDKEQKVYLLIARAYVAQFYRPQLADETHIELECEGHCFVSDSKIITVQGWSVLYRNEPTEDDDASDDDGVDVRQLEAGQSGECASAEVQAKQTKPQPLYTIATLLTDLTRAAKYVKNDRLRKALLDRDKDKEGENGGIGTPATRDTHIKNLFARGYLTEKAQGKKTVVVTTQRGMEYYDTLPDQAKYPDMTAIWVEQFKAIEKGQGTAADFIRGLIQYVEKEIARVQAEGLNVSVQVTPCPKCKKPLRRLPHAGQFFWACTDREACGHTMSDKDGKPVEKPTASALFKCGACGKGLIRRDSPARGKQPGGAWWGCEGFKDGCKQRYPDFKGKPNYGQGKGAE